jgi:hypothetical protein
MSLDIYVFLSKTRLPSAKTWQAALNDLGTSIVLDDSFDPLHDRGFVPCKFGTAATGFEFLLDASEDLLRANRQLANHVRPDDVCAVFTWGGDLKECAAAVSAAASLTAVAEGIMYDPQEDERFGVIEAQQCARKTVAEIGAPTASS